MATARAPDKDRKMAEKLMAAARESADDVAGTIYKGVLRGDFLILPTRAETLRWRIKRFAPDLFLRQMLHAYRGRGS
jgi:hypothetical protein